MSEWLRILGSHGGKDPREGDHPDRSPFAPGGPGDPARPGGPERPEETAEDPIVGLERVPAELRGSVEAAIRTIRPLIRRDHGDVQVDRFEDGTLYVRLVGACGGCPLSETTLRNGIEREILLRIPDIDRVEAV
jgi:Fe-S cluster biogenesis protein NfuA